MHTLSFLGTEDFFLLLVPFIFWCAGSGFGARLLSLAVTSDFLNGLLTWVFHLLRLDRVDSRVKGLEFEASYGLPSGYMAGATGVYQIAAGPDFPVLVLQFAPCASAIGY